MVWWCGACGVLFVMLGNAVWLSEGLGDSKTKVIVLYGEVICSWGAYKRGCRQSKKNLLATEDMTCQKKYRVFLKISLLSQDCRLSHATRRLDDVYKRNFSESVFLTASYAIRGRRESIFLFFNGKGPHIC